ncbi:MAG: hypothetical protein ACR2GU_16385 [Rubrobacteraceae bacterium]
MSFLGKLSNGIERSTARVIKSPFMLLGLMAIGVVLNLIAAPGEEDHF